MSEDNLKQLRAELDKIDIEIQDLLIQRAQISLDVKHTKQADDLKLKPGREAQILRDIVKRHNGSFPKLELIRIWREILSASLQTQSPFKVAVYKPENNPEDNWGYISAARNHFGSYTPMVAHPLQRRVVEAVLEDECSAGILPIPQRREENPWWRHLAVQGNTGKHGTSSKPARIIAKLPFAEPAGRSEYSRTEAVECLVIAKGQADSSGLDETYVVLDLSENIPSTRIESRLVENNMSGLILSVWHDGEAPERWLNLMCIKEFILADNIKLDRLTEGFGDFLNQVTVLGSYATPITTEKLIQEN